MMGERRIDSGPCGLPLFAADALGADGRATDAEDGRFVLMWYWDDVVVVEGVLLGAWRGGGGDDDPSNLLARCSTYILFLSCCLSRMRMHCFSKLSAGWG